MSPCWDCIEYDEDENGLIMGSSVYLSDMVEIKAPNSYGFRRRIVGLYVSGGS